MVDIKYETFEMNEDDLSKVLKRGNLKEVMSLLEKYPLIKIIDLKTKATILDILVERNDLNIIEAIKNKEVTEEEIKEWFEKKSRMINLNSYELIQECMLYRCVIQDNLTAFDFLCTPNLVNRRSIFMGPSVLELVVKYVRVMYVRLVLSRSLNFDQSWNNAIDIAQQNGSYNIASLISKRHQLLNTQNMDGFNRIHIAVLDNDIEMVKYILKNKYVDLEEEDKFGKRPLHLAVEKGLSDIVQVLLNYNCNSDSLTKAKQTPLDIAIENDDEECQLMLQKALDDKKKMVEIKRAINESNIEEIITLLKDLHLSRIMDFEENATILDTIIKKDDKNVIDEVKKMMITIDEIKYWTEMIDQINPHSHNLLRECMLYKSIKQTNRTAFDVLFTTEMLEKDTLFMGPSLKDTLKEYGTKWELNISLKYIELQETSSKSREEFRRQHIPFSVTKAPILKKENLVAPGTYGNVWKHFDSESNRIFAVKKIWFCSDDEKKFDIEDLKHEISIYTKLPFHERIIQYFGSFQDNKTLYIYMNFMDGGSIKQYLDKHGPLEFTLISWYSKQILEGLDFLHRNRIIHRDIKGHHILRDLQDNIKICDFGLSKYIGSVSFNALPTNSTCGTPYWMAPEVINGDDYSYKADVWSFGATVIEMITGQHPYPKLLPMDALFKIGMNKEIVYTSPKPITKELKHFLNIILVGDPAKRASVKDLLKSNFILSISEADIDKVLKRGSLKEIMYLLERHPLSTIVNFEKKLTICDELLLKNDKNIIDEVKKKAVTTEEIKCWRESKNKINASSYYIIREFMLYRCIVEINLTGFDILCIPDVVNQTSLFMGPSILDTVIEFGRDAYINTVLSRSMKIDESGNQAIDKATQKGYENIVSLISKRQHDLEIHYKDGYNRLHIALLDNDFKMVKYILKKGLVDKEEGDNRGLKPIHCAAIEGNDDMLKLLIKHKCNKEAKDKKEWRAIHYAAEKGLNKIVKILIDSGCDIACLTKESLTPLDLAKKSKNTECILLLGKDKIRL